MPKAKTDQEIYAEEGRMPINLKPKNPQQGVICGPGHPMRDETLARLNLKRKDDTKDSPMIVLGVHGTECLTVLVLNATVVEEGLFEDGVAVPIGKDDPIFEMPPSACCPGVQGTVRTKGYGNPGGAYALEVVDEKLLRTLHPDSKFAGKRVWKSDYQKGGLYTQSEEEAANDPGPPGVEAFKKMSSTPKPAEESVEVA